RQYSKLRRRRLPAMERWCARRSERRHLDADPQLGVDTGLPIGFALQSLHHVAQTHARAIFPEHLEGLEQRWRRVAPGRTDAQQREEVLGLELVAFAEFAAERLERGGLERARGGVLLELLEERLEHAEHALLAGTFELELGQHGFVIDAAPEEKRSVRDEVIESGDALLREPDHAEQPVVGQHALAEVL